MHGRALLPVLVWTLFAVAGSPSHAEQTTQLQRLNVGDFRAYFTANAPGSLQYRTTPLIEGAYFYTAVKTGAGNMIEGFNFSRNEDGLLQFGREKIEGGYRLTWKNKRWIYDPPTRKTDRLAGEATVTLTLTAVECSLRYQGKIEPNVGFGEIGFFLSEEGLTKAGPAAYTATLANEQEHGGTFPLAAEQKGNLFSGLAALKVSGVAVTHDLHLSGQAFPGSHGVVFQDYRKQDRAPGCYRVVLSFDTTAGNEFDYTWRLWVEPKAGASPVGASARDAQLLTAPLAKMPEARATLGDAQAMPSIRHGDRSGDVGLQVAVTEQGQFLVSDGEQQVVGDDYFQVFAAGVPKRQETVSGDVRRISLRYDSPTGQLTKEAFVSPDEVWLAWTVKAKVEGRGEVGFYCPAAAFRAPFISYRAINQSTVAETDKLELSSTYCLLSGGAKDTREFQCGTSRRPDWVLQDFTDRGNRYRFVATPSLKAGEEWRAVFRFVRKPVEPYPAVSFDQAREERGIVSTLLTDALEGGFTVVPARSAKYTFTDQPLLVRLKYYAVDRRDRTVDLSCRLIDTWGREVATRDYRLASGGERFAAVELPVTVQTNGAYRMEIAYRCGEVAGTRELTFTALPTVPDTGSRPGSVFGAALGYGDFLGTLAKRIGLKWNRCHCAIGDTQCGLVQPERGQYAWEGIDEACDFHQRYQLLGLSLGKRGLARAMALHNVEGAAVRGVSRRLRQRLREAAGAPVQRPNQLLGGHQRAVLPVQGLPGEVGPAHEGDLRGAERGRSRLHGRWHLRAARQHGLLVVPPDVCAGRAELPGRRVVALVPLRAVGRQRRRAHGAEVDARDPRDHAGERQGAALVELGNHSLAACHHVPASFSHALRAVPPGRGAD